MTKFQQLRKRFPILLSGQIIGALFVVMAITWLYSCKDDATGYNPSHPVSVESVFPASGGIATRVAIIGDNFGTDRERIKVFFGTREAVTITVNNDGIYALVPKLAAGPQDIRVVVDGQNEGKLAAGFTYEITSAVSTVAGTLGTAGTADGSALDAMFKFQYSASSMSTYSGDIAIDGNGNLLITDQAALRAYSAADNAVTTIQRGFTYYQPSVTPSGVFYVPTPTSGAVRYAWYTSAINGWGMSLMLNDPVNGVTTVSPNNYDPYASAVTADGKLVTISCTATTGSGSTASFIIIVTDLATGVMNRIGTIGVRSTTSYVFAAYNPVDHYIYYTDVSAAVIRRFDPSKSNIKPNETDCPVVCGGPDATSLNNWGYRNGLNRDAYFYQPSGICCDAEGNIYVADRMNNVIRRIVRSGDDYVVTTFAGLQSPNPAFNGNKGSAAAAGYQDGLAEEAKFRNPRGLCVDSEGILYVVDVGNYLIRRIAVQ